MTFKKYFKLNYSKKKKNDFIYYGRTGLVCLESYNINSEQLSSITKHAKRLLKKKNSVINRIHPFWWLTRKPRDVRMGRGKGTPVFKVFPIKAGMLILEFKTYNLVILRRILKYCSIRCPMKVKIIIKDDKHPISLKGSW